RNAIAENDIETANALLGYPYFFEGLIVEGNQLGRTIGYPTANLHITSEEKLVPGDGVYAVSVNIKNQTGSFNGMMNIGIRPTIGGKKRVIEVNIFDFDATVYGDILQVQVHRFLRGEIKFNGLEELKTQLQKDKEMATAL
ncbi:riboflavin biosynthesis protein RibF, partial|uniref:riboflavin kinase n=1 Tax=Escherichia coli TaxID=562 RepID=UPI0016A698EE